MILNVMESALESPKTLEALLGYGIVWITVHVGLYLLCLLYDELLIRYIVNRHNIDIWLPKMIEGLLWVAHHFSLSTHPHGSIETAEVFRRYSSSLLLSKPNSENRSVLRPFSTVFLRINLSEFWRSSPDGRESSENGRRAEWSAIQPLPSDDRFLPSIAFHFLGIILLFYTWT